ncbi:MAG: hypothetical protein Q9173_001965 [Seirophora scorigena]
MALRLFGNGNGASNVKHFEIRTLILRGNENEASSAILKGTLILCLSEPLRAPSIRLRFTGQKRVGWDTASSHVKKDEVFVRHTWEFMNTGSRRGETLAAGNYEWPFDYILPGHTPESVEGLQDSWIIYRMKATIDRGILAQNILARKHVRVVRTLDTAALELSHEMAVDNTWADKIDYTLSTPTKGVIFGTAVQVNFRIASLLKGLKIGEVSLRISETQDVIMDARKQTKKSRTTRNIAEDNFDFPQDQETVLVDGQDSWVFTRQINLPKSLRECLQTVDALGIRTKHSLLFNVKLINPDKHVSELHASLPLYIYISPNLLLDESNNMIMPNLGGIDPEAFAVGAPPMYGDHQLDMLYNDLDPAGYLTPAGGLSGIGTPFSQSRRGSADNLASINPMASAGSLSAALQSRLSYVGSTVDVNAVPALSQGISHSAQDSPPGGVNDGPGSEDYVDPSDDQQDSDDHQSRRMSENGSEHAGSGLQHCEFSPEQLSKVPSYSTALRSPHQTPISEVPPTYQSMWAGGWNRDSCETTVTPVAQQTLPTRTTGGSANDEDAVPDIDTTQTSGLLQERLQAYKHACGYLENYITATEKVQHAHAKEYEKVLKTVSDPLKEGHHFDQSLGGIAGLFENIRSNTKGIANSHLETEKTIKGSVLPVLERLHAEIKNKSKELSKGAVKGSKEVDKARNVTQKHIELLGQHTAAAASSGGKVDPANDPYVLQRGVNHRLHKQVLEENNNRHDLIEVQNSFAKFEAHVIQTFQQALQTFFQAVGGQHDHQKAMYGDIVSTAQKIPLDFEFKGFVHRNNQLLVDPSSPKREVSHISFPNQNHVSTQPLIAGTLERKSRGVAALKGFSTDYYVVTPSKFLHEFKDDDDFRKDPTPELSLYLPDCTIGAVDGVKFNIKGKDASKGKVGSAMAMSHELSFKAHSPADAERWYSVIKQVAGGSATYTDSVPSPTSPVDSRNVSGQQQPPQYQEKNVAPVQTQGLSPSESAGSAGPMSAGDHAQQPYNTPISGGGPQSAGPGSAPTSGIERKPGQY